MSSNYPFSNNPYAQQTSPTAHRSPVPYNQENDSRAQLLPPTGNRGYVSPASSPSASTTSLLSRGQQGPRSMASRTPSTRSVSEKFSLSPDPSSWGANLSMNQAEPDDDLHNPDPRRDRKNDQGGSVFTPRGIANLGCLFILGTGLITLFAGYPIITFFTTHTLSFNNGFGPGGTNASGQVPSMPGNWALIDSDTPQSEYSKPSYVDGTEWELVFSDEFNVDGRTFYPGDDPYWEAVDLHYWATGNLEWYDPSAVTTANGSLEITLSAHPEHGLNYTGGMIQSWNKFCFTGGMFLASVSLPGVSDIAGFWPAVWAMGNLGRAGYGATLEGMWPYTYDHCDVGTVANQSYGGVPSAPDALFVPDPYKDNEMEPLSFLPGQRLSRCTCQGESHPGPVHADGSYVGRAAPEIDMFEAQAQGTPPVGAVSQSAQWAPFNYRYQWQNTTTNLNIPNKNISSLNTYIGGDLQQATSVVTVTNPECYTGRSGCFETYGFEYVPGFDGAYIAWIANDQMSWSLQAAGMGQDNTVEIYARPISQEPMYLMANLGMSPNFGTVNLTFLPFPSSMRIDWIRVYQPSNAKNVGCDPPDFPTEAYINQYIEAYMDPNLTTWRGDYQQPFPKNSYLNQC